MRTKTVKKLTTEKPELVKCGECRCMEMCGVVAGLCKRRPPVYFNSEYSMYPTVRADDGCFDGILK